EGTTYRLTLPADLIARGINPVFHASLLRPFYANDDTWFPGRSSLELPGFKGSAEEWAVTEITDHYGRGRELLFEVHWNTGHVTWERVREVKHLAAFQDYLLLMGVKDAKELPVGREPPK
ncbi:hypothetical protein AURDEDRAFT_33326, partial [Auricularia subglabra TFB-10046 SS5]